MFIVKGIKNGTCLACEKDGLECFEVECQKQTLCGLLCPRDFKRQVKMRQVAMAAPTTAALKDAPTTP